MKVLLLCIIMLSVCSLCFSDVVYTKVSDGIFTKTITEAVVTTDNHTITSLKEEIARLEDDTVNVLNDYNRRVERNNNRIAELQADITEAKKVGCVEITNDLDILP